MNEMYIVESKYALLIHEIILIFVDPIYISLRGLKFVEASLVVII
jgi:hypothetical protein